MDTRRRNHIALEGQVAIVTGGARGIGRAIVERILRSGGAAAIWDVDLEQALEAQEALAAMGSVHVVDVDLTDPDAVNGAMSRTLALVGKVQLLVNNAGIAGPTTSLWEYPLEAWRRVIDVDLHGIFHCCRTVVPHMIEQGYGRIVNVASIAGKEGNPNASAYSAAKAAVIALTKSLGKELAGQDVAVNCITPAVADTDILKQFAPSHTEYMLSRIPRGRFVKVEEIAAMVAWLLSSENSFTTGAVFDLSGGRATY